MTASTVKSTKVTAAFDTKPPVVQRSTQQGGVLVSYTDSIEAATTSLDEANDIILMLPMPSNLVLKSLVFFSDDLDSDGTPALAFNIGVANGPTPFVDGSTSYAAYAAIDADNIGTAVALGQAADTAGTNYLHEALDIASHDLQLWEIAGLASDPHKWLTLQLKVSTPADAAVAGTITVKATGTFM